MKLIILYSLALSKTYFSNRHTIVVKLKRSLWFTNLVFSSFKWNRFNCWINFSFCSFARVFLWKCSLALIHRAIVLNFSYLLPKLLFIFLFRKFFQTIAHTQTHTDRHSLKPYRCTYFFFLVGFACRFATFFRDMLGNMQYKYIEYNKLYTLYARQPHSHHDTPFDAFDIAIENKLPMLNEYETCKTVRKLNWRHIACMHSVLPPSLLISNRVQIDWNGKFNRHREYIQFICAPSNPIPLSNCARRENRESNTILATCAKIAKGQE